MKAIILAAGKWTRLRPITDTIPKVMVEVDGKPLLQYNLEHLAPYVDEFIIVVKYLHEVIRDYFGSSFSGVPISYHLQSDAQWTGAALWGIEIEWDCFIVTSDQIFNQKDVDLLAKTPGYGALARRVTNPEKYGIFRTSGIGKIEEIIEKPNEYIGNLASVLYFKVNSSVVVDAKNIEVSSRGEYELIAPINQFAKTHDFHVIPLQYPFLDITSIADLEWANLHILELEKPPFWTSLFLEQIGEYTLSVGIRESSIEKIIEYSNDQSDTALMQNTGDKKRFSDREKFESWYRDDGRYLFSLTEKDGTIAGIWYGRPSELPELSQIDNIEYTEFLMENAERVHTGWIRIYPNARGKWLATPLILRSSYYYRHIYPDAIMSIDIDEENIASQKAYEKAGYISIWFGENRKTIEKNPRKRKVYIDLPKPI